MKHVTSPQLVVALGLGLLLSTPALAQRRPAGSSPQSPQERAERRTQWLDQQLQLHGSQYEEVLAINQSLSKEIEALKTEYPELDSYREERRALTREHLRSAMNVLTPAQKRELRQQVRARKASKDAGPSARGELLNELNLSDGQRAELGKLRAALRQQQQELAAQYSQLDAFRASQREIAREHRQQLQAVLTEEQQQQLRAIAEEAGQRLRGRHGMKELYPASSED